VAAGDVEPRRDQHPRRQRVGERHRRQRRHRRGLAWRRGRSCSSHTKKSFFSWGRKLKREGN
jgi:hypothetical protein